MNEISRTVGRDDVLRRVPELKRELSAADIERLQLLLTQFRRGQLQIALSKALDAVAQSRDPLDQLADLRAFRKRLTDAAGRAGVGLRLEVDSKKRSAPEERSCWFTLPALDRTTAKLTAHSRAAIRPVEREPFTPVRGVALERDVLVVVVHSDREGAAKAFIDALDIQLNADKFYAFRLWSPRDVVAGERVAEKRLLQEQLADVVVDLLSPLRSPELRKEDAEKTLTPRPRRLPVMLEPLRESHALGRYEGTGILTLDGKSFSEVSKNRRSDFVARVVRDIRQLLQTSSAGTHEGNDARNVPSFSDDDARRLLRRDAQGHPFIPPRGVAASFREDLERREAAEDNARSSDMIDTLMGWVKDSSSASYAAVLGEFGIGKTTLLRELTRHLLDARESDADLALPIFIDLRLHSETLHHGQLPTSIEHFVDELLRRLWQTDPLGITAKAVLRMVREEGALLIFDGLDEKLVHLDEAQGQAFIRLLWQALPPYEPTDGHVRRRGKLLFSCRSHFFKTFRAQSALFLGEGREGLHAEDYRAWRLLPFGESQIRCYLEQCLGETRAAEATALFASIHNLRELAQRPYLLSLLTQHIDALEARKQRGAPVRGVTVYELLVEQWLMRDDAKHNIRPEDKLRLMENVAAALWRDKAREWSWPRVREWLLSQLAHDERWRMTYRMHKQEKLEQDFRAATFVLRPDQSESAFRFAHTSLQEYFFARYLIRALRDSDLVGRDSEAWMLPEPSRETYAFVGELIETANESERERALLGLTRLLEVGNGKATQNAFCYWLVAVDRGLPEPNPRSLALAGLALPAKEIVGCSKEFPLSLAGAQLQGADFSDCTIWNVDFAGADLRGARLDRAELLNVDLGSAELAGASFVGAALRECRLDAVRDAGKADWYECHVIDCKISQQALAQQISEAGAVSEPDAPDRSVPAVATGAHHTIAVGHSSEVHACAFSPDGAYIVSGSADGTVTLWDARTGRCMRTFGHCGGVNACAFSSDGATILSGSGDGTLKLWDVQTGDCMRTFEGHDDAVLSCAFSPDGGSIVSGSWDGTLRLWKVRTGLCLRIIQERGNVDCCAFSPDGTSVLSGSGAGTLILRDIRGKCLRTFEGHNDGVEACAFSRDGDYIVSGAHEPSLVLWDARTGRRIRILEAHADVATSACMFSPDGATIISSGSDWNSFKLWDARTGRCLRIFEGHAENVSACAFSPDGQSIVSGSRDLSLMLWDARTGRCLQTLEGRYNRELSACAFSPDGTSILAGVDDHNFELWDARTGRCLQTFDGQFENVSACAFSRDGTSIVSGSVDGTLKLWNAATGRCLRTVETDAGGVYACAFSPNGGLIVPSSSSHSFELLDAQTGCCLAIFEGHTDVVHAYAFSPDGSCVVSASADRTVKLWDADTGRYLWTFEGHLSNVHACAFSPDGEWIVSGSNDHTLKLWNRDTGSCLRDFEGHLGSVYACAFSPDGAFIISASADHTLKLWNARTGRCQRTFEGHSGGVHACAFSADGATILSSSYDRTLRRWDTHNAFERLRIVLLPAGEYVAIADGAIPVNASELAWRYIHHTYFDERRKHLRTVPAEHNGRFPVAEDEHGEVALARRRSMLASPRHDLPGVSSRKWTL